MVFTFSLHDLLAGQFVRLRCVLSIHKGVVNDELAVEVGGKLTQLLVIVTVVEEEGQRRSTKVRL